jgi:hypothetical protein
VVLKILLGMPDRRGVVRRYITFSKSLAGWARDRALESMRAFGNDLLEPTIELLSDPDEEVRGSAMLVAQSFEDRASCPATIRLLKDPDWWIASRAETLGRLKDPRGVPAADGGAVRSRDALERRSRRSAASATCAPPGAVAAAAGPGARGADRGDPGAQPLPATRRCSTSSATSRRATRRAPVRARAFEITLEMSARQQTPLADDEQLKQAALAAKVGRRRAQAQRAPGRHPQQRRLRLPPVGRPAAGDPARRRPGARARASPSRRSRPRRWCARS